MCKDTCCVLTKSGVAVCRQHGLNAVSMSVAEQYIAAFSNLAKETNTVLLPSNSGDVSSMVSQVHAVLATALRITPCLK